MSEGKSGQLTLDFEPSLPERFETLRDFMAYRVHAGGWPLKVVAADLDMGTSTLSRKLAPGPGDTQRFNTDDLERYIATSGDTEPITYLIAKFMQTKEARRDRVARQAEELMAQLARLLPQMQETK